jgi:hypothetical protein
MSVDVVFSSDSVWHIVKNTNRQNNEMFPFSHSDEIEDYELFAWLGTQCKTYYSTSVHRSCVCWHLVCICICIEGCINILLLALWVQVYQRSG